MSKKNYSPKRYKKSPKLNKKVLLSVLIFALVCIVFFLVFNPSFKYSKLFSEKIALLHEKAFASEGVQNLYPSSEAFDQDNAYVVFISLCDTKSRAVVIHEAAPTIAEAWEKAETTAKQYIKEKKYNPVWVKADIVDEMKEVSLKTLNQTISTHFDEFYRRGIAFDEAFTTALLEAEINGNKLIDYDTTDTIDLEVLNKYLTTYERGTLPRVPKDLITFTCLGFMCDENNNVFELNDYEDIGLDYGRRQYPVDREALKDVVLSASYWLQGEIKNDGRFVYGYYPTYDKAFTAYNVLRHTTGILPLIWSYEITKDEGLKDSADVTMTYLLDQVVEKSDGVSFVLDVTNNEIKLGGNGLAIIGMDTYMDAFGRDEKMIEICKDLGEGMLELQNPDGSYYHVLNTDFTRKEEYRTVYYDGEATYAFCILYKLTGEEKWLNAAKRSVEYFIANDYTKHRDHWVAYALNEITKHVSDERYYEFGLRNLSVNIEKIHNQKTTYHTYMELLMAGFEMYDRMVEEGIRCEGFDEFDADYFARTIQHRAEHMLNGFLYPEYAMYLKNPRAIVGTFCVRHDGYRIRIDDVDHFVAGYYHYYELYDDVQKYMK
ncbi:MAG: glycosyl hydrolase family 88 [Clostridia bacterium]|nr:glycosyl hydrolase family 88 [Clostridia bacterium]